MLAARFGRPAWHQVRGVILVVDAMRTLALNDLPGTCCHVLIANLSTKEPGMKRLPLLVIITVAAMPSLSMGQTAAIPAIVSALTDKVCTLEGIPRNVGGGLAPTNREHRLRLHLRCEALGGNDRLVSQSCCEHLTDGDSRTIGRCPTNPVGGGWMAAFRQTVRC